MRKVLLVLWRIWFYLLCMVPILLLFPSLVVFVILPNGYKHLYWVARHIWAPFVLFGMGFWYTPQPLALWSHGNSYSTDFSIYTDCFSRPRRSCGRNKSFNGRSSSNPACFSLANLLERFFSTNATRDSQRISTRLY